MTAPRTAVLFPGVGSCVAGSLRGLRDRPAVRATLGEIDAALPDDLPGRPVSDLLLSPAGDGPPDHELLLQLAALAQNLAVFRLLEDEHRLRPQVLMGHSLGELTAIAAAGVITAADATALLLACDRARTAHGTPPGALLALRLPVEEALSLLAGLPLPEVVTACSNGPAQTVFSGPLDSVTAFAELAGLRRITHALLPTRMLFHHPLLAPVATAVRRSANRIPFHRPRFPVHSPLRGRTHHGAEEFRDAVVHHLVHPVPFGTAVARLYGSGVRVFLEAAPRSVLTPLARSVVRDAVAVVPVRAGGTSAQAGEALAAHGLTVADLASAGPPSPAPRRSTPIPSEGTALCTHVSSPSAPTSRRPR
ncbi:acyltransferase domain-containing protein [Kitasatospora albolonga]|uniref:ACP S-malonyltransferase n=1 Tax=Kitasatospora albolonga TaxID=68173 RepID=UPI0031F08B44